MRLMYLTYVITKHISKTAEILKLCPFEIVETVSGHIPIMRHCFLVTEDIYESTCLSIVEGRDLCLVVG